MAFYDLLIDGHVLKWSEKDNIFGYKLRVDIFTPITVQVYLQEV